MKRIGAPEIFTIIILIIVGLAVIRAIEFPFLAAVYPIFIGGFTIACCIIYLIRHIMGLSTTGGVIDIETDTSVPISLRIQKVRKGFIWLLLLYGIAALLGFKIGALLFIAFFVRIEAKASWTLTLALTASVLVVLVAFHRLLRVFYPIGLLGQWLADPLPWLF
jgi:hypothetical protein